LFIPDPDPDPYFLPIPDPGTGSRIRNRKGEIWDLGDWENVVKNCKAHTCRSAFFAELGEWPSLRPAPSRTPFGWRGRALSCPQAGGCSRSEAASPWHSSPYGLSHGQRFLKHLNLKISFTGRICTDSWEKVQKKVSAFYISNIFLNNICQAKHFLKKKYWQKKICVSWDRKWPTGNPRGGGGRGGGWEMGGSPNIRIFSLAWWHPTWRKGRPRSTSSSLTWCWSSSSAGQPSQLRLHEFFF
jgi:hypothetical protein